MINDQQKITFSVNCASYKVLFLLLSPVNVCPYYSCLSLLFKSSFPALQFCPIPIFLSCYSLSISSSPYILFLLFCPIQYSYGPVLLSYSVLLPFYSCIPVLLSYSRPFVLFLPYSCSSNILLSFSSITFFLTYSFPSLIFLSFLISGSAALVLSSFVSFLPFFYQILFLLSYSGPCQLLMYLSPILVLLSCLSVYSSISAPLLHASMFFFFIPVLILSFYRITRRYFIIMSFSPIPVLFSFFPPIPLLLLS